MIRLFYLTFLFFATIACGSCSSGSANNAGQTPQKPEEQKPLNIAKCIVSAADDKLEIATWNIEHFPKTANTSQQVANIIKKMDVDVIALQEIKSKKALDDLVELLSGYEGVIMQRSDINLAYIYKTSEISLNKNPYGILQKNTYELPRSPFVLPIHSKSTNLNILLVNNHFKAKGGSENEARRKAACALLKNWIDTEHADDNVIVLGDLNDEITDAPANNVFKIFLDDNANYSFADKDIAKNRGQWSYPSYPSHIDHILLTNELFDNKIKTYTYTFGKCDQDYDSVVSDHYPVCVVLE